MTALEIAAVASLLVMLVALPMGAFRMLAYRSGEVDHSPAMRIAAWFAFGTGLVALLVLVVSAALLLR